MAVHDGAKLLSVEYNSAYDDAKLLPVEYNSQYKLSASS